MAFSFPSPGIGGGGFGGQAQDNSNVQVQDGPDLLEIQTKKLGFAAINGEARLKLLQSPWPKDSLPPPTSCLLSVASRKGLLAAAGPDTLVVALTKNVREAFQGAQDPSADSRTVKPEANLAVPRLSQIAFSADENVLVVSGQEHGGLAAYSVDRLLAGHTDPALQISTNDSSLRALVPNPAPELAELLALVTTNGELLMADLKAGGLRPGSNGPVLKTGVSCVSWSNKGKQLVAGSADGTATQLKQDGTVVQDIPKPTQLPVNTHMSGISWLENDSFLVIYTPNDTSEGAGPQSDYYIITRQKNTSNYVFQRLPEVCVPCGMPRVPAFHFIVRLRKYEPHLQDLLILASTNSPDVGTVTKTDMGLSEDNVTGAYTNTIVEIDSRRAGIPLGGHFAETSPIGMSLDLSSTEAMLKPIPDDPEIEQSSTPLPNLFLLNHEGTLSSWWVVHDESIRQKVPFHGLTYLNEAGSNQQNPPSSREATPAQTMAPPSSAFGQPGFGGTGSLTNPAASTPASPFTAASTFGSSTTLGGAKPSWASTGFGTPALSPSTGSGFGQPAFGAATPIGGSTAPAFGVPSPFSSRPSPLGQPVATPAFGQPGGLGANSKVFGSVSATSPFSVAAGQKTAPFSSFATSSSGFATLGSAGASPFAKAAGTGDFSKLEDSSPFASRPADSTDFGGVVQPNSGSALAGAPFKLHSSFQGGGTAKHDLPKPANPSGFGFGNSFGDMLADKTRLSPTHDKEADMEDDESVQSGSEDSNTMTNSPRMDAQATSETQKPFTPPSTINQSKSTPAAAVSSLFEPPNPTQTTTPQTLPQTSTGFSFTAVPSTTPKDPPTSTHTSLYGTFTQPETTPADVVKSLPTQLRRSSPTDDEEQDEAATPTAEKEIETSHIKAEPLSDDEAAGLRNVPEAPLPPDPTSKASYSPGDTSAASSNHSRLVADDAPLPPDFVPANKTAAVEGQDEPYDGPADDSSDFEGSGEDVTQDISPIEEPSAEPTEQVHTSPESSFHRSDGPGAIESPTGGLFTTVTKVDPATKTSRTLFGEVGIGPIFPPPKQQESPRSPSPVRHNNLAAPWLRPDATRASSAPAHPPSMIDKRRKELEKTSPVDPTARAKDLRAAKEKAEADARAAAQARAEEEAKQLEDNEDELLREELNRPVSPYQDLHQFMPYQPDDSDELSKAGIPGQIERLYRDINSMIDTLGINARSLTAFMLYQQGQQPNHSWPSVLNSETPTDALNDEWVLEDIRRLHEGEATLTEMLEARRITDVAGKLQSCQELLSGDLYQLRTKLSLIRKSVHAKTDVEHNLAAPLSAEQVSIQHDLRKASTSVQMKLSAAEQELAVLRAKLAEVAPSKENGKDSRTGTGPQRMSSQKKPTVEAVTSTIAKLTSMAEKKSAEVDILEAQLRRLGVADDHRTSRHIATPDRSNMKTPASAANSVYHTPDSRFNTSTRSTKQRMGLRESVNGNTTLVSTEDRERWREKVQRKQEVSDVLRRVLADRRRKKLTAGSA